MQIIIKNSSKPIRILYPLYDLNSGPLSNWLMGILRRLDRKRFQVDFLLHNPLPGYFDQEARSLGARIIICPNPRLLWTYLRNFTKIMREYGPYDVIHSCIGNVAFHMRIAHYLHVPIRISHIHANFIRWDKGSSSKPSPLKILFFKSLSPYWITRYSTLVLTITKEAARATLGRNFKFLTRWEILPCGIELDSFTERVDQKRVREEVGIPESAFVIGHVGRFAWQKNQIFAVKIAAEINRYEPNVRLLLVGDGILRPEIEAETARMGLADKVIFTGLRGDVPQLMLGAMDAFLFPVHFEDLGMVLIEAQAAGLPCIVSDNIVEEAVVVKPLVKRLSLNESASTWAKAVLSVKNDKSDLMRAKALQTLEKSYFNIDINVDKLQELYSSH